MSLYSWNVIATVAEHHSISQAANILNLTPSAVSHMVKKVEDGVGYALFIRERNHFELTSAPPLYTELFEIRQRFGGGGTTAEKLRDGFRPYRRIQQCDPGLAPLHFAAVPSKVSQHQSFHPPGQ